MRINSIFTLQIQAPLLVEPLHIFALKAPKVLLKVWGMRPKEVCFEIDGFLVYRPLNKNMTFKHLVGPWSLRYL